MIAGQRWTRIVTLLSGGNCGGNNLGPYKRTVCYRNTQRETHGRTYRLYDRDGQYLEIAPNGGKWWRLKYRLAKKEKRVSLGVYPEVDLKGVRFCRSTAVT